MHDANMMTTVERALITVKEFVDGETSSNGVPYARSFQILMSGIRSISVTCSYNFVETD